MKKEELLKAIAAVKDEYFYYYTYIGVRTQEKEFDLGEIDHCSSVWVDGEETDDTLDGISCTNVNSPAVVAHCEEGMGSRFGVYFGDHVALIGSNDAEYGEDEGELIMRDAVVLKILS